MSYLQKVVVDRGGLAYSPHVNRLCLANRPNLTTAACRVPKALANLFGPMRGCHLNTGPEHNRIGVRHA